MKRYAMIIKSTVIDIVEKDYPPVYPPDPDGNQVLAMECEENVQVGDQIIDGIIVGTKKKKEKTQLDRIEEAVNQKNSDIAAAAIDAYTLELMEGGLL